MSTRAQLLTEISTSFADNTSGAITPAVLRAQQNDVVNSLPTLADANTFTALQTFNAGYSSDRDANPIAFLANKIAEGTATQISMYGDSIYFGLLNGGGTASPTQVSTFQTALRNHYNNSAATLINNGVSGNGTTDVIGAWAATMSADVSDAIIINYGVNDAQGANSPAISAAQYAENLRLMILQARATGKIVILETPVATQAYGTLGTQTKAERVKQFAQAMREVAAQENCPILDTYKFSSDYNRFPASSTLLSSDGIHPTQVAYNLLGYWHGQLFFRGAEISAPGFVSASHPSIRFWNGTTTAFVSAGGSKFGQGIIANHVDIPILVTQGGLDIYIATPVWSGGTTALTITVNGQTIATPSLFLTGTGSGFPVDREIMVLQDAQPGAYLIAFQGSSTSVGGLYYLRAVTTRKYYPSNLAVTGTAPTSDFLTSVGRMTMTTPAGATGLNFSFSSVPMSNLVADTEVEFTATFAGNQGVSLFGGPTANNTAGTSGYVAYLDNSTGFLTLATGAASTLTDVTAIGGADLRSVSHDYRFYIHTSGVIDCYVDGALIGSFTPTTTLYRGGYIGLYINGAGATASITNLVVR